jgi:hypothetical protein
MIFFEAMDYNREEGAGKRTLDQHKALPEYEPLQQNFVSIQPALATKYNAWGLPQPQPQPPPLQQQQQVASYDVALPDASDDDSI